MNIGYRIIWVDDTPEWVDSIRPEIVQYLEDLGYEPSIDFRPDGTGLAIASRSPDLDLLLIDYNLHGDNGDVLISAIRQAGTLTEIVFYSQNHAVSEIVPGADGVFRCKRDDFEDTVKKVVDLTHRKLNDLTVIRGLVIASAIDIEVKLEEIMIARFGTGSHVFRTQVIDKMMLDFGTKSKFIQRLAKERLQKATTGTVAHDDLKSIGALLKQFDKEVIDSRNILAHSRRTVDTGRVVLKGVNDRTASVTIDAAWLSTMRATLKRHLENLERFEQLLANDGGATSGSPQPA